MRLFIIFVTCVAFGVLGVFTLQTYNLYTKERVALVRERGTQFSIASSLWRYGVITEVNTSAKAFIVRAEEGGVTKNILVYTTSSSILARQDLIGDGPYTGLTAPTVAEFADLTVGTKVALLLENRPEEGFIFARIVLLGNPL